MAMTHQDKLLLIRLCELELVYQRAKARKEQLVKQMPKIVKDKLQSLSWDESNVLI